MYRELVRDRKLALAAEAGATFPDGRYPIFFCSSWRRALGHTADENQKALEDLLERFKAQRVDAQTLARVISQRGPVCIRRLDNNAWASTL